ncbi:MAG: glutamate-1-semialdehyde 2,1-aminomutase [Planctomycetes bacterium]|nr:glutamate-1-semialdehyde 2,1-aminomutase [Planctomycetota bacterium]
MKPRKTRSRTRSHAAYAEAQKHFPGGVNSPVRSWRSVGLAGEGPFFVARAKGAELVDLDGHRYIDFVGSWGPMILGHANSKVVGAIRKQAAHGASYGCPTELESRLALRVKKALPSIEKLRFVSSGSEAVMHALRVARGFTGREKILKFDGCYHGASDGVLVKAGSGAATFGVPDSAGVPASVAQHTLTVPFNDLAAVKSLLDTHRDQVAAVVLEPVVGNAGVLLPEDDFLPGLAACAKVAGALLIFDEVMTGFRLAPGGAQQKFGIRPDLTTLGKILGGGLPCAAYGGRMEIMDKVAPLGPVYQAGTLSGNPLAMAAGLATLDLLLKPENYARLEALGAEVERILLDAAKAGGWGGKICLNRAGSMFTVFFHAGPVRNFADAAKSDTAAFGKFFRGMLDRGVYFPPSQYEAAFLNLAMGPKELKKVAQAARATFANL